MRKVLLIVLGVILLLVLGGCGSNNIASAELLGYEGVSFEETMKNYCEDLRNQNDEISEMSYEWIDGWVGNEAPDSSVLNSNEEAMTYSISLNLSSAGSSEVESNRILFYVLHDTNENTLTLRGGMAIEDGKEYPMSAETAREFIEGIDYYRYAQ